MMTLIDKNGFFVNTLFSINQQQKGLKLLQFIDLIIHWLFPPQFSLFILVKLCFFLFPGPFDVPIRCQWIIDASNAISANTSIIVYLTQLFTFEGEFTKVVNWKFSFNIHYLFIYPQWSLAFTRRSLIFCLVQIEPKLSISISEESPSALHSIYCSCAYKSFVTLHEFILAIKF